MTVKSLLSRCQGDYAQHVSTHIDKGESSTGDSGPARVRLQPEETESKRVFDYGPGKRAGSDGCF